MESETEQRIRAAYQAFVSGDFDTLNAFFHPDAEYVNPDYAVEAGTRQGTAQLTDVWHSLHEMFEFEELHIDEIREAPQGVFVVLRLTGHGRASGAPTLLSQSHLLKLRDGRAVSLAWFGTREEGLRAAGLA
jgi:ketosteroid isomerase-like protein